ncbi:MAG: SDR family oxidoreductase [Labilithrix sp.]|nr:SDR family oxidoreductase [Labilithrix sp.]MCW5815003.1 SDR family oxidoreductase [Labilithrix sp.]
MAPTVVVTGSTKGLGLGLVRALVARGANVVVSGRKDADVASVCAELGDDKAHGRACDVSRYDDVRALWGSARERFGRVDVWVNNAGTSNAQRPFVELPPSDIAAVVGTNLAGMMNGSRVALEGMLAQAPHDGFHGLRGAVYNMEGFGADGARQRGMALYGSTKTALRYFTRSLVDETRDSGVVVGTTSPGIVVTELLTGVYERGEPELWRSKRRLFNFIADPVETVAPWLARRILDNTRPGAHLAWMTVLKGALRFFRPKYWRRDLFAKGG